MQVEPLWDSLLYVIGVPQTDDRQAEQNPIDVLLSPKWNISFRNLNGMTYVPDHYGIT